VAAPAIAQDRAPGPAATFDHIALNAADADVSAAFYSRAFGFTEIPTKLPNTRWLSMGNGFALHLIGGRTAAVVLNRIVHVAVRTDDLEKSIAYFDANRIAWSDFTGKPRTIQTRFDGVRQIFVQDPDGFWIEVSDNRGKPAN
jgi:catechol 2,3-dioxygenase-like lactoylglutathione lyase family enzyme